MWLRHFLHKRRQKKFKKFKARYYAFHPADTEYLCIWHHEEISIINYGIIAAWARRWGPCRDWKWVEAEKLMNRLRRQYKVWVKLDTPGCQPRHVAQVVSR